RPSAWDCGEPWQPDDRRTPSARECGEPRPPDGRRTPLDLAVRRTTAARWTSHAANGPRMRRGERRGAGVRGVLSLQTVLAFVPAGVLTRENCLGCGTQCHAAPDPVLHGSLGAVTVGCAEIRGPLAPDRRAPARDNPPPRSDRRPHSLPILGKRRSPTIVARPSAWDCG